MGPKVAKRKAASQATVNVVEEVAGPSVEKKIKSLRGLRKKRIPWWPRTSREKYVLVI